MVTGNCIAVQAYQNIAKSRVEAKVNTDLSNFMAGEFSD